MPISSNVTAVNQVLKLLYKKGVPNLSYNKQALLDKIAVQQDFTGEKKVMALQTSNPQGFGSDFNRAYDHKDSAESYKRFEMFRVQHYGFAQVAGEVMRTAVDPGSLVNVWRNRTESIVRGMQNSAGRLLYGSGTGRIGSVSAAGTTTTTVTLQTPADIANFEVGMYITMYTAESFAAQYVNLNTGGPSTTFVSSAAMVRQVTAVNRDLQTASATLTLDTAASWPSGAIITRDGDGIIVDPSTSLTSYDGGVSGGNPYGPRAPAGIKQWIAGGRIGSQPYGNTLFGLDRSSDKIRLGGSVLDGTGLNMVEALQTLESSILFQGMGYPTHIAANTLDIAQLKKSALSDVIRIPATDPKQNLNFQSVVFVGQNGAIPFVEDPFCPRGEAYMLNLPSWSISTAPGGMFQLVDWDGNGFLRLMDSDNYQARFASYYQIGCINPGSNGYVYNWGA